MKHPSRVALMKGPAGGMTTEMLRGIARYVREHRPWDFYSDDDPMFKPLPGLRKWRGHGILCFVRTPKPAKEILGSRIPAVNVSSTCRHLSIPQVISDNEAVGRLAAESLLATGLSRFGFVNMAGVAWSDDRRAGFIRALDETNRSASVFEPPPELRRFFLRTTHNRTFSHPPEASPLRLLGNLELLTLYDAPQQELIQHFQTQVR